MRYFFFLLLAVFCFSCSKSFEERCFVNDDNKDVMTYQEQKPYTALEIVQNKPQYLKIVNLKKFRSFKKDSTDYSKNFQTYQANKKFLNDQKILFSDFDEKLFEQFRYSSQQISGQVSYALGENGLGYWLLEIKNNNPRAYFLGLSYNHYYFNKVQEDLIVKNGFLQFEGSFVKIEKVPGLSGYKHFSVIEDGKLFKIKLDDIIKDSDQDGFNDIFENSFGLNPNSKDTDEDGIDDFSDHNPLFKSEKNKFTTLYEDLISQSLGGIKENLHKMNYFFLPYKTDCDYFQKINIEAKVLIFDTNKEKQPSYVRITDVFDGGFSKIKRNNNNPNIFYVTDSGNAGSVIYEAEYKNGKWFFRNVGGINI